MLSLLVLLQVDVVIAISLDPVDLKTDRAGYTFTLVVCIWAGAVMKRHLGRSRTQKPSVYAEKAKCHSPIDQHSELLNHLHATKKNKTS